MYPDDTPPGISAGKFQRRISQKSTARVLTVTRKDDMIMGVADAYGEVSERFMELVLKTSDSQEPRVRIPSSPPFSILAAKKNIGLGYHLEMYSSW